MIDFSKEIKKKNENDDEEPQLEKDYTHDMKKKKEIEKEELLRKLHEAESNISSSHEKSLEMEKE
ncbi:hypothetical protein MK435_02360 [Streptococcus oralis]|uniref:hypothetical protein n=1 Tax=Streptococcus TaxID=1301 RepID=UPI002284CDC0|nr:hypothetical protein [Streptococcus oralis]MDU6724719.1 hypothetical protein [Streptococcus mitis]HEU9369381.1 hypothetical protein [Streptococcus pneumoniae]MCY7109716.1 hypothetical protein [Streptococcus oralis]HEV1211088.1 hypothetical protein [Streptococcus pneumoniae]HEV1244040.1 hypothetical protein [Streptococcus pneumoniae]